LRYGLLAGVIVYLVRAIPVGQFILNPEFGRALSSLSNTTTNNFHKNNNNDIIINKERQDQQYANLTFSNPQLKRIINAIIMNMVFGITLGLFSLFLSIKLGARYRCPCSAIYLFYVLILNDGFLKG
jgi:hypothetical protein